MSTVLVLNTTHEPLHRVGLEHAIGMLVRGVAVVVEHTGERFGPYLRPTVLRLVRYVRTAWKYRGRVPRVSTRNVLRRDDTMCGYCGKSTATTLDHVVPRSQGGPTTWRNAIAACSRCNERKGARTPDQAGMPLLWIPFEPSWRDVVG